MQNVSLLLVMFTVITLLLVQGASLSYASSAKGASTIIIDNSNATQTSSSIPGFSFGLVGPNAMKHWTPSQFESVTGTSNIILRGVLEVPGSIAQSYAQAGFSEMASVVIPKGDCHDGNNSGTCQFDLQDWEGNLTNDVKASPFIKYWEIWNEPQNFAVNDFGYLGGCPVGADSCPENVSLIASRYAEMLKAAYGIIHSYIPDAVVIGFGGSNIFGCSGDGCSSDPLNLQWCEEVWNDIGPSYMDAISIHAYPAQHMLTDTVFDKDNGQYETVNQMFASAVSQYVDAFGKPIYVTETGVTSDCTGNGTCDRSPQTQAMFLQQDFEFFESYYPNVKAVIWFEDIGYPCTNGLGQTGGFCNWGLWNQTTWEPKPAFYTWDNFITGRTGQTSSPSSGPFTDLDYSLILVSAAATTAFVVIRHRAKKTRSK